MLYYMLLIPNFYRSFFSADRMKLDEGGDSAHKAFGSLRTASELAAGGMYRVVMFVAVFAALASFVAYGAMMVLAVNGRERDESRKRLERGIVSVALIFSTLSIVMIVFKAFI